MSTPKYKTYMTDKIGPLPYCPGCGHGAIVKALDKALVKLQPDPKEAVIVTDIGCIGLSDRYFITSAFHGLHGRSITYACGLKLARPDLTVIAIMGDGACGIGGTHLLNVARRNIGITLIVANNFNYGMTGGQHSVTTPTQGLTSTTPWGNVEGPMDLCGTVVAAGGAWVYRGTSFDKDLPDVIASAIEQPGFAMLDIWELCSAYYMPRNKLDRKQLFALLDSCDFKLGMLSDKPRPEYSVSYREAYEQGKKSIAARVPIELGYANTVGKQTGIIIAGSAGQRIRSAATLFAEGAMHAGLNATQKDDYPITVRTGHSVSEIIFSPERIDYTGIDSPEYMVLISKDGLNRLRARVEHLPDTCVLFAEESLELPETPAEVRRFPFLDAAKKVNRLAVATLALGAVAADTGMFPVDAMAAAIRRSQSPDIADVNLKALAAGAALVTDAH